MTLYRVLSDLSVSGHGRISRGTLSALPMLSSKGLSILLERGAVAEVSAPPLEVIPQLADIREQLVSAGYRQVSDLLTSRPVVIASDAGVSKARIVEAVELMSSILRGD